MSTLVYGALTRKREEAPANTSTSDKPPGLQSYVDALAALVPAEVLALHAVIIDTNTTSKKNAAGQVVTTISNATTLKWAFAGLVVLTILLYVFSHSPARWDKWDFVRAGIPPIAFVGWAMLQKTTVFDAIAPGLGEGSRFTIALFLAVVLAGASAWLARQADQMQPTPPHGQIQPAPGAP
jgi:hypothetical protein